MNECIICNGTIFKTDSEETYYTVSTKRKTKLFIHKACAEKERIKNYANRMQHNDNKQ